MSDHHLFSPSSLFRREACPGSAKMEGGMDDQTSAAAEEGTFLHAAVWDNSKRKDCDFEQLECLEVVDTFLADEKSHFLGDWEEEVRLKVTDMDPFMASTLTWGTVDAIGIRGDGTAVIADWKFGRVEVPEPAVNLQLAAYACAVMQEYPVTAVDAYIVQPRVRRENHPHWRFKNPEAIADHIQRIIVLGESSGLSLQPGSHCNYCKARHKCHAMALESTELVERARDGLDLINPSNAAEAHDQALLVRKVADQILAHCKRLTEEAGGQIPGLEIVESQGARQVSSPQQAYEVTAECVPHDTFMSIVTVPVGKLESAYSVHAKKNGRFDTIKAAKAHFGEVVEMERKPATRKLVRREVGDANT